MAFRTPLAVRFGDCDPAGLVYYPRFFHHFHAAMEELFAVSLGLPYPELTRGAGLGFPAVHVESDFRSPLRYGEAAEIEVAVERLGETSCTFRFRLFAGGEPAPRAEARVVTVCVDLATLAKRPIPDALRASLARHLPGEGA
jgi:4-hydroxybenzoyl-CoA thioesterase